VTGFSELAAEAARSDWRQALRTLEGDRRAYELTVDDPRAAACLLAVPEGDACALDLSCGCGSYTFALARVCHTVYAADADPDAVRFVELRASQSGVDNVKPLEGLAEESVAQETLDLIVSDAWPAQQRLDKLVGGLRPGGRLCLGTANARAPGASPTDPGIHLRDARQRLGGLGFQIERCFLALPHHRDARVLLDAYDRRGLAAFLHDRYPYVPRALVSLCTLVSPIVRAIAPGFWIIASRPDTAPPALACAISAGIGPQIGPSRAEYLPMVHANRGTLTLPVYRGDDREPTAYFRMDAARSLVGHEAGVLTWLGQRVGSDLQGTFPDILSTGRFGHRTTAGHSAVSGRGLPIPRTPRRLARQLGRIRPWLSALYQLDLNPEEIPTGGTDDPLAIYRGWDAFNREVGESEAATWAWSALEALGSAGLRQSLIHGDLHPGNILEDGRHISCIDWEYATAGWVPFDWCHYIGAALLDGGGATSCPKAAEILMNRLHPESGWGRVVSRATHELLPHLRLDTSLAPGFLLVGFFDFARRRYGVSELAHFLPLFQPWTAERVWPAS
jgi:SAM-dependent methyltransferase